MLTTLANIPYKRVLAGLLALFSAASLGFTLFIGARMWQIRPAITSQILDAIQQTQALMDTTTQSLDALDQTLTSAGLTLSTLEAALLSLGQSITTAVPVITDLETLVGGSMPSTITSLQTSLTSAQETARVIEDVLRAVSQIPFFPGGAYNPETPLADSLGQVSADIEDLRLPLLNIQGDLRKTRLELTTLGRDTLQIALNVKQIRLELAKTQAAIGNYQIQLDEIKTQAGELSEKIPAWSTSAAWLATFFLGWVVIGQGAFMFHWLHQAIR